MPAYATNMRLKFPILALILEAVTIVLYALFVVYDTGDAHGGGHHAEENNTHSDGPMTLYPSKYLLDLCIYVYMCVHISDLNWLVFKSKILLECYYTNSTRIH